MMHSVVVYDEEIVKAFHEVAMKSPDNPLEEDLVQVRSVIATDSGRQMSMLSLFWLRNRIVHLRKAGKLVKRETARLEPGTT